MIRRPLAEPADRVFTLLFPEPAAAAPGEAALARALLAAAHAGAPDLGALVAEWIEGRGAPLDCPTVAAALDHLAAAGAPAPGGGFGPGLGAALVTLPLAARLHGQPRNLVAAVYHVARLLDPAPAGPFLAVGLGLVARCYLGDRTDFLPDVLDVLLANDAPADLVERARRAAIIRRRERHPAGPLDDWEDLLWLLRNEPASGRVVAALDRRGIAGRLGRALTGLRGDSPGPPPP